MKKLKLLLTCVEIALVIIIFQIFLVNTSPKEEPVEEKNYTKKIVDRPLLVSNIDTNYFVDTYEYKYSDSEFEEKIINAYRDQKIYKIFDTIVDGYLMHILVVYDASHIRLMCNNNFNTPNNAGLERITDMVEKYDALVGVNAGGFYDAGKIQKDIPDGYVIKDGQVLYGNPNRVGRLIGFDNDNNLALMNATGEEAIKKGMRDAVEFGPFLIINGQLTDDATAMAEKRASRVVISQRKDGIVLIAVSDGGANVGARMSEILATLLKYGAYNAANLDGGASTQLVINGEIKSTTRWIGGGIVTKGRKVLNGWGVFEN